MYKFDKEILNDFEKAKRIEFFMPNGLGGYVSATICNNTFQKFNSYLTHSFNPPVARYVLLSKINEEVIISNQMYSFACQQHKGYNTLGNKYLSSFEYGYIPTYLYEVNNVKIIKKLSPYYGQNACAISYEIINNNEEDVILNLIPLFSDKFLGEAQTDNFRYAQKKKKNSLILSNDLVSIYYKFNLGKIVDREDKYINDIEADFDISTGDERLDFCYTPINHSITCSKGVTKLSVVVSTKNVRKDAFKIIDEYSLRYDKILKKAALNDDLANRLTISGDSFICDRKSTGLKTILAGLPWFTDWGRDTMIAFTGLVLVPRRFKEARQILLSFSKYERNGLIPNMFPSNNEEPLYNTVDASLWYFYACYKYILYTGDYEFIIKEIFPTLKNIIEAYKNGTDFNIHMDSDYLIIAGSNLDQITWMDVRVGDFVVTPRHGKPVEINALWYNALKIMEMLCEYNNEDCSYYKDIASKVKESFNRRFFNPYTICLYDVLDEMDSSVRPNQLFVTSLPFKLLDKEVAKRVVETCKKELLVKYGVRSLSPNDPRFKPEYKGKLWDRDMAYHMGTSWGFIIGAYIDSYAYVYDYSEEALEELVEIVKQYRIHLNEYCLNGVAEIFDGLKPDASRGCSNQAWSVGELLRSYYENLLVRGYKA